MEEGRETETGDGQREGRMTERMEGKRRKRRQGRGEKGREERGEEKILIGIKNFTKSK